jgi:hypothetical protein
MTIFLCVLSVLTLGGVIGEKDLNNRKLCAACFGVSVICATALQIAPLFLK